MNFSKTTRNINNIADINTRTYCESDGCLYEIDSCENTMKCIYDGIVYNGSIIQGMLEDSKYLSSNGIHLYNEMAADDLIQIIAVDYANNENVTDRETVIDIVKGICDLFGYSEESGLKLFNSLTR